jgi:hypothetical protein
MSTLWKVLTAFAIGVVTTAYLLAYSPRDFGWPVQGSSEPPTALKAEQQTLAQLDAACDDFLSGEFLTICVPGAPCPDPSPKALERSDRWQRIANSTRSAAEVLRLSGQVCLNRPDTSELAMLSYVCNSRNLRTAAEAADPMLFIVDTVKRVYAPAADGHCPTDRKHLFSNPSGK